MTNHKWPEDSRQHVWGPWLVKTGPPKPTHYRQCVHPQCKAVDYRDAPNA
jgi:hypothetical protein